MMKAIDTAVNVGSTIEIGAELSHADLFKRGNNHRLRAISHGEPEEHVILNVDFDGELDDVPDSAKILGPVAGMGITGPTLYFALPKSEYE